MQRKYNLYTQLMALLLISLFLQSCDTHVNCILPRQEDEKPIALPIVLPQGGSPESQVVDLHYSGQPISVYLAPSNPDVEELGEDKGDKLTLLRPPSGYSGPQWVLSEEEIEYIFKASNDFVCILEFGGHFKKLNQAWQDRLGWGTQELLDVPYINFVHPDDVGKTLDYEKKFTPIGLVNRYRCKDGSYCWIDWIGLSQRTEETGKTQNLYPLNIGRDVTVQKLLEEESNLEVTTQMKLNFLAHMSHEVRTPLTGLIGLLDLIDRSYLHEEDLTHLKLAYNSALSILIITNDILDITKMDKSQLKLESIEFSPLFILHEVIQVLGSEAEKKGIDLNLMASSKVPQNLVGDPIRFRQILFNLISNGVKFTNKGTVLVSINGKYTSKHFTLTGDIIDTGIGISSEVQKNLFIPFSQADNLMLRPFGGVGRGLFISKKLAKLMGGDINLLSSEEDKGSTFRFNLNFGRSKKELVQLAVSTIIPDKLPDLRVLVADDNAVNLLILTSMLKKAGCSVTTVVNGLEAVEAVTVGEYDIVLMDGEMPVMDGLEATKKIRERFSAKILPIIGVTAHAMTENRERFLEAGMNGYVTKPIQKVGLFSEILRCLAEKNVSL